MPVVIEVPIAHCNKWEKGAQIPTSRGDAEKVSAKTLQVFWADSIDNFSLWQSVAKVSWLSLTWEATAWSHEKNNTCEYKTKAHQQLCINMHNTQHEHGCCAWSNDWVYEHESFIKSSTCWTKSNDEQDREKWYRWLHQRNPFLCENANLQSLATGIVSVLGEDDVCCDRAEEIGEEIQKSFDNLSFPNFSLKRNSTINPMSIKLFPSQIRKVFA